MKKNEYICVSIFLMILCVPYLVVLTVGERDKL